MKTTFPCSTRATPGAETSWCAPRQLRTSESVPRVLRQERVPSRPVASASRTAVRCASVAAVLVYFSHTCRARPITGRGFRRVYYDNNGRCTFTVLETTYLSVVSFSTQSNSDYLTVDGTRYSGTIGPAGISVSTGANITWYSDGSTGNDAGFTICRAAERSPTFVVTTSNPLLTTCFTTASGNCITNGAFRFLRLRCSSGGAV